MLRRYLDTNDRCSAESPVVVVAVYETPNRAHHCATNINFARVRFVMLCFLEPTLGREGSTKHTHTVSAKLSSQTFPALFPVQFLASSAAHQSGWTLKAQRLVPCHQTWNWNHPRCYIIHHSNYHIEYHQNMINIIKHHQRSSCFYIKTIQNGQKTAHLSDDWTATPMVLTSGPKSRSPHCWASNRNWEAPALEKPKDFLSIDVG